MNVRLAVSALRPRARPAPVACPLPVPCATVSRALRRSSRTLPRVCGSRLPDPHAAREVPRPPWWPLACALQPDHAQPGGGLNTSLTTFFKIFCAQHGETEGRPNERPNHGPESHCERGDAQRALPPGAEPASVDLVSSSTHLVSRCQPGQPGSSSSYQLGQADPGCEPGHARTAWLGSRAVSGPATTTRATSPANRPLTCSFALVPSDWESAGSPGPDPPTLKSRARQEAGQVLSIPRIQGPRAVSFGSRAPLL